MKGDVRLPKINEPSLGTSLCEGWNPRFSGNRTRYIWEKEENIRRGGDGFGGILQNGNGQGGEGGRDFR